MSESTSVAIASSAAHRAASRWSTASSSARVRPATSESRTTSSGPASLAVGVAGVELDAEHGELGADRALEGRAHVGRVERRMPRLRLRDRPDGGAAQHELGLRAGVEHDEVGAVVGGGECDAHAVGRHGPRGRIPARHRVDRREHRQHPAPVGARDRDDRELLALVDRQPVRADLGAAVAQLGQQRDQQARRRERVDDVRLVARRRCGTAAARRQGRWRRVRRRRSAGSARSERPAHGTPAESAAPVIAIGARAAAASAGRPGQCPATSSASAQRERAGVQRLADDRALEPERHELAQRGDVVEARDAAGGDDRAWCVRVHDLAEQVEVRPLQRAVLRDVGDHVARGSRPPRAGPGPCQRSPPSWVQPRAASVVPRTSRPTAIASPYCGDDVSRPLGVLERRRAEVDALGADLERGSSDASSRMPPESSTLTPRDLADDLLQDAGVAAAAERRVEVDEVDPLGALARPSRRRRRRGRRSSSRCRPRPG